MDGDEPSYLRVHLRGGRVRVEEWERATADGVVTRDLALPYVEATSYLPVRALIRGERHDGYVLGWRGDPGVPDLDDVDGQAPRMGAGGGREARHRAARGQSPSQGARHSGQNTRGPVIQTSAAARCTRAGRRRRTSRSACVRRAEGRRRTP